MIFGSCDDFFSSVKEEVFWRNYFYRVSLIKQSAQLTALAAQQQQKDGEDSGVGVSPEDVVLNGQAFLQMLYSRERGRTGEQGMIVQDDCQSCRQRQHETFKF